MASAAALGASTVYSASTMSGGEAAGIIFLGVLYVAVIAFSIYLYVRVAHKAGYSGWYVALLFVPIANIVITLMFVFKEWPIERELAYLRGRVAQLEAGTYGALGPGQQFGQLGQQPHPPGQGPAGSLG